MSFRQENKNKARHAKPFSIQNCIILKFVIQKLNSIIWVGESGLVWGIYHY